VLTEVKVTDAEGGIRNHGMDAVSDLRMSSGEGIMGGGTLVFH
jgi:hypothetical protein